MMGKTYEDDQKHPKGIKGSDVIPDTLDHADIPMVVQLPGCGVTRYLPGDGFLISHGGFSNTSKTVVYDRKVKEIRKAKKDTSERKLPQGGTFLSEDEILHYASAIKKHREMTGAKSSKEEFFEKAKARCHPGTDAVDTAKDGIHRQSDSFDIDKSQSTISIGITTAGGGVSLNGSKIRHSSFVAVNITGPDGRYICRVEMSPEQFASALFGNMAIPCTLQRYWSINEDSIQLTERVRPPESIYKRMKVRLKNRLKEQKDALEAVVDEIMEQAESGKPMRKTMLKDVAERIARALDYSEANAAFTVGQAREEIASVMEAAAIQHIGHLNLKPEALYGSAGPALEMEGYDGN